MSIEEMKRPRLEPITDRVEPYYSIIEQCQADLKILAKAPGNEPRWYESCFAKQNIALHHAISRVNPRVTLGQVEAMADFGSNAMGDFECRFSRYCSFLERDENCLGPNLKRSRRPGMEHESDLRLLTSQFKPGSFLPARKATRFGLTGDIRPALLDTEFGRGDLLLAVGGMQGAENPYYLIWVDSGWLVDDDVMFDNLDGWVREAIHKEFGFSWTVEEGHEDSDDELPEDRPWWAIATAEDVLSTAQRARRGFRF